ncbi:MAG: hypothetical protein EOL91_03410 [Actinobacteria bacterium]|nr:hypothetical protein [Actinomycetota bacterium]
MGLTRMVLVVLMLGLLAFLVTLTFRSRRVVPADLAMERALRRTNTTTAIAALGGLGFAAWGWSSFPTVYVSATEVPGLLAALGPALAGLVFLAVTAAGESTWPRPAGSYRAAHLERRPLFSRPQSWAARALWTWTALLAALLVLFGAIAEPDGRSIAHGPGVGECLADGVPVPCGGGASGPFPGWPYGLPMLLGAALVVAATLGVLHVVARRPAVRGTSAEDDALLRTISATRVVRGAQLSQGTALAGVTFFAGATSANAGWWWAWPLLILAVVVLGTALGVALRRVAP